MQQANLPPSFLLSRKQTPQCQGEKTTVSPGDGQSPPRESSTCVTGVVEKRKTAKLSRRRGVQGWGKAGDLLNAIQISYTSARMIHPLPLPPNLAAAQVFPRFRSWHPSLHYGYFPHPLSGQCGTRLAACHAHGCLPLHPRLPLFPISLGNSAENN